LQNSFCKNAAHITAYYLLPATVAFTQHNYVEQPTGHVNVIAINIANGCDVE